MPNSPAATPGAGEHRFKVTGDAHLLLTGQDGRILFGRRQNTGFEDGAYHVPAGHLEAGESIVHALIREAKEEIGVTVRPENLRPILTCHRREPAESMSWVDMVFEADSWEGEVVNAEPHMHSELAWLDSAELPANVIPSVRFMLEQIAAGKTYCEYGWN